MTRKEPNKATDERRKPSSVVVAFAPREQSMLEAALAYATQGIPVFPCKPNKAPRTKNGLDDATTDAAQIVKWWTRNPTDMIGVPTGPASGLAVVDLDKKRDPKTGRLKNGYEALPDWRERSTRIALTPSGGAHLYFKDSTAARNTAGTLAEGVDTRGERGYVVAPPSKNADGEYRWLRNEPDELPPWPKDLPVSRRRPPRQQVGSLAEQELDEACLEMVGAEVGSRNDTLNRLAFMMGGLIASGRLDESVVRDRLSGVAETAGLEPAEIEATLESGIGDGKRSPRLPTIMVSGGDFARVVDQVEAELLASAQPIFERGGRLVEPAIVKRRASDGKETKGAALRQLTAINIVYAVNKFGAAIKRYDARKKTAVEIDPPVQVATGLIEKGQWTFPRVVGVITSPTMRPDGSVLDRAGYDAATQLYYQPDGRVVMPVVPDRPTRAEAEEALALFRALLRESPFVSPTDEAVAVAGLMTPILRGAFSVAPMILIRAIEAGSGKSYIVNLAAKIVTGDECPVITAVPRPEEMEKRLGALILEGAPLISLDNCSIDIGGDLLCQIAEQPLLRIRILGKSEAPKCEWRGVLFATGNNVLVEGDMTRRTIIANLDAQSERPELRQYGFDPMAAVDADRGKYIAAALVISRAWRAAGEPKVCGQIASYGGWSKAVRAPLIWLGMPDPVSSMDQSTDEDPARANFRNLVAIWRDTMTIGVPYTVAQIVEEAEGGAGPSLSMGNVELKELLMRVCGDRGGHISTRSVGRWLVKLKNKVHGGYRLEVAKESEYGNAYALTKIG